MTATKVSCAALSIGLDPETGSAAVSHGGCELSAAGQALKLALNGEPARLDSVAGDGGGLRARYVSETFGADLTIVPADGGLRLNVNALAIDYTIPVELEVPLAGHCAVHIPLAATWGARYDMSSRKAIPLSGTNAQLAAVEADGRFVSVIGLADYSRHFPGTYGGVWQCGAKSDGGALWLRLKFLNDSPVQLTAHESLAEVVACYHRVLTVHHGQRSMAQDPSVPEWLHELRATVILRGIDSDGGVHDTFAHARSLCGDLERLGLGGKVNVRLVGFQGPFDSRYPYFDPAPELGGPEGMHELADAVHAIGARLNLHFDLMGMDPYLDNFEQLEHLAMPYDARYERIPTGQIGPYEGWPGLYPAKARPYESPEVPVAPLESGPGYVVVQTPDIPFTCEAFLTVSGVRDFSEGRLGAKVGIRRVVSPPGHFAVSEKVRFRFRLKFAKGPNRVRFDFTGGVPDLSESTFRIEGALVSENIWSYPIVRADVNSPEWLEITRNNMVRVCKEYGVDIPYIDVTNIWRTEDRPLYEMLKRELPGKAFCSEKLAELGLNIFRLSFSPFRPRPTEADKGYAITDLPLRLYRPFVRLLTPGYSYVPGGGMQELLTALDATTPEGQARARQHLNECREFGIVPAVRLNYRQYGLDAKAREVLSEACG